jgi:hypothetical protein
MNKADSEELAAFLLCSFLEHTYAMIRIYIRLEGACKLKQNETIWRLERRLRKQFNSEGKGD